MDIFPKKKPSLLSRVQLRLEGWGVIKKETFGSKHALHFLNFAQFFGVINDNVFKFLIVFLFIHLRGVEHSSEILFWVGTVYVLPFLLFSSAAGVLADRFSKQRLVVILKLSELIIMVLGVAALAMESSWACYSLLFLLSAQSAFFGPPKYSIIPELVQKKDISKANGLITSFTYLGIIIGTTVATTLTQLTDKNWTLTGSVTVVIAFIGFIASLCIPKTMALGSQKRINPLFVREIYHTLVEAKKWPFLLTSIFGASSFLFIGAYFQLNVIPFAIESLNLTEVYGGYLFLLTAIGIAFGSMIAGRISKNRVEIGLSCFAGIGLTLLLLLLYLFDSSLIAVVILLLLVGTIGGLFIVPFDSYIQTHSPHRDRGRIVAASNFLSFVGVLLAPLCILLFNGAMDLTAAKSFAIVGLIFFVFALFVISHLKPYFFNYFARLFVRPLLTFNIVNFPKGKHDLLIIKEPTLLTALLLASYNRHIRFYTHKKTWLRHFGPFRVVKKGKKIANSVKPHEIACFLGEPTKGDMQKLNAREGEVKVARRFAYQKPGRTILF